MKKILLLGSTGSIGKSTENTIRRYKDRFKLIGISLNMRVDSAIEQINEFHIPFITIGNPEAAAKFPKDDYISVTVWEGEEGLLRMAEELDYDIMVNALLQI